MGNVMTGRQAYGEYDSTASENQSDHIDDPLAELARIVSEGDEYLRKQRLEAEAEEHSDVPSGYDQGVERDNGAAFGMVPDEMSPDTADQNPVDAADARQVYDEQGYAPASYQPESSEFHQFDSNQPVEVQPEYQQSDYQDPEFVETDFVDPDASVPDYRDQQYQQPETHQQAAFEPDAYPADNTDPIPFADGEAAAERYSDNETAEAAFAPEAHEQQVFEPDSYEQAAAVPETGPAFEHYDLAETVSGAEPERHPDDMVAVADFAPLPEVSDPFEAVSNATGALTESRDWANTNHDDYGTRAEDQALVDPYRDAMEPEPQQPVLNEADFQPAIEPVAESTDYSDDGLYYESEAREEPVGTYSASQETRVAPDIQLDPAALVGPDDYADQPYAVESEPFADVSGVETGYDTEPRVQYEPQPDYQEENIAWPEEGDPYTIDPRENVAMQATANDPQGSAEVGDLSYGVDADGDLVETVPPIAGVSDPVNTVAEPASRNLGLKAMAAVVALSLLGGGGLFAYRTFGGAGATGEPKVIKADAGPFKIEVDPSTQTGATNTPGSGVYKRLSGDDRTDKSQERIIVGKEEPVNVARNTDQANAVEPRSTLPKPVKTIVVKPDGTFVSRPDPSAAQPAAAAEKLSQTTPSVAAGQPDKAPKSAARVVTTTPIRTVTTNRTNQQADKPVVSGTSPAEAVSQRAQTAAETIANANPTVVTSLAEAGRQGDPTVTGRATEETAPLANAITVVPRAKPPVPAQRTRAFATTTQPTAPAVETQPQATAAPTQQTPAAATQKRATPAIPKGAYIVQVSSQRSRKQAQDAYSSLQRRYPSVLGSVKPVIQKADLGDRGTYYRVRLGPYQQQAAARLCSNLKSAGGECFVRRN